MAATLRQGSGAFSATAANTLAKAYVLSVNTGSLLACRALWGNVTQTCTVADNVNGAWASFSGSLVASGSARIEVFYKVNTSSAAAGAMTVTMTTSANQGYRVLDIAEFEGVASDASPDGSGGNATGSSTSPSASVTTTVDHDLVVGGTWVANAATAAAPTVASSITDGNSFGYVLDKTPAGAQAIAWTQATGAWAANAAAFQIASAVVLQDVLPDADVVTTGWATAPLFSKVNDASDATVITSTLA